jgi:hypothetical protein
LTKAGGCDPSIDRIREESTIGQGRASRPTIWPSLTKRVERRTTSSPLFSLPSSSQLFLPAPSPL